MDTAREIDLDKKELRGLPPLPPAVVTAANADTDASSSGMWSDWDKNKNQDQDKADNWDASTISSKGSNPVPGSPLSVSGASSSVPLSVGSPVPPPKSSAHVNQDRDQAQDQDQDQGFDLPCADVEESESLAPSPDAPPTLDVFRQTLRDRSLLLEKEEAIENGSLDDESLLTQEPVAEIDALVAAFQSMLRSRYGDIVGDLLNPHDPKTYGMIYGLANPTMDFATIARDLIHTPKVPRTIHAPAPEAPKEIEAAAKAEPEVESEPERELAASVPYRPEAEAAFDSRAMPSSRNDMGEWVAGMTSYMNTILAAYLGTTPLDDDHYRHHLYDPGQIDTLLKSLSDVDTTTDVTPATMEATAKNILADGPNAGRFKNNARANLPAFLKHILVPPGININISFIERASTKDPKNGHETIRMIVQQYVAGHHMYTARNLLEDLRTGATTPAIPVNDALVKPWLDVFVNQGGLRKLYPYLIATEAMMNHPSLRICLYYAQIRAPLFAALVQITHRFISNPPGDDANITTNIADIKRRAENLAMYDAANEVRSGMLRASGYTGTYDDAARNGAESSRSRPSNGAEYDPVEVRPLSQEQTASLIESYQRYFGVYDEERYAESARDTQAKATTWTSFFSSLLG